MSESTLSHWFRANCRRFGHPVPDTSPALAQQLQRLVDAYLADRREDNFKEAGRIIGLITASWGHFREYVQKFHGTEAPLHPDAWFCAENVWLVNEWTRWRDQRGYERGQQDQPKTSRIPDDVWKRFEQDRRARARGYESFAEMAEARAKRSA